MLIPAYLVCEYVQGFVISDWQGVDKISSPPHSHYTASVRAAIQAGIDMVLCFKLYIHSCNVYKELSALAK